MQGWVVLLWNYVVDDDQNVVCVFGLQCLNELWYQCFVVCCLIGDIDYVYVVFYCLLCGFFGGLEKWVYVYVKVQVGKVGGNYFGVLVVVVLFYFDYQNVWVVVFGFGESVNVVLQG